MEWARERTNGYLARSVDERRARAAGASVRVVIGVVLLTLLPALYPRTASYRGLWAGYVIWACVTVWLVWKDVAPRIRPLLTGLVDSALLTFVVHRTGSLTTMWVWLYFFQGLFNTLLVGRATGLTLAVVGSLSYAGIVLCERAGLLPYGPDAPPWADRVVPDEAASIVAAMLLPLLLVGSTAIAGKVVEDDRRRERALVAANHRLEELSRRDPLTQLYNRRHLMSRLEEELRARLADQPLSVAMIDLDGFKRVNDLWGHLEGDRMLVEIGRALGATSRESDVVGRYGGDEIVVVMPRTDLAAARRAAERFRTAIRQVGGSLDPQAPVTASVGVALARAGEEARALLQRADALAYEAKRDGGDRVVVEGSASA